MREMGGGFCVGCGGGFVNALLITAFEGLWHAGPQVKS